MARRKLSDFEKVQARADFVAEQNKQFSPVQVAAVQVEDWTDDDGEPIVTVQESENQVMDEGTEAAELAKLIAAEPWQEIVGPPKKKGNGGWFIPTKHFFATWPHDEIPHAHSVYVKRENNQYWVACIFDIHGKLHHR